MIRVLSLILLLNSSFSVYPDNLDLELQEQTEKIYTILNSNSQRAILLAKNLRRNAEIANANFHEANALYIEGWLQEKTGESGLAFADYFEALKILQNESLDEPRKLDLHARLLLELSSTLKKHKEVQYAKQYLKELIAFCEQNNLPNRLGNAYNAMSSYYSEELDDQISALQWLQKTEELALKIDNSILYYRSLNQQGLVHINLGNYDTARHLLSKVATSDSDHKIKYSAMHNIGHSYLVEGDLHKSLESYSNNELLIDKSIYTDRKFLTWLDLCDVNLQLGRLDEAEKFGKKAEEVFREVELKPENYRLFELMATVQYQKNEFKKSFEYSQRHYQENARFLQVQEDLIKIKNSYSMHEVAASFLASLHEKESATSNYYNIILSVISGLLTCVLLIGGLIEYNKKRSLKNAIVKIAQENIG